MQDQPTAEELVGAVRDFILNVAMPQLQARDAFHARVAANALGIVQRELEIAPDANAQEHDRLRQLVGVDGTLEELNRELCNRIRAGEMGPDTPGMTEHLWDTTLTKLGIDQPKYSGYQRALQARAE